MLNGVLHEGLHGDRGYKEIFGGEVGDLDDHIDGVAEADLEKVEVVADKFYLFFQQDEVFFLIAENISIDLGKGVVIEPGVLWVAGDEKGERVQRVENEVGVYLIFQRLQLGLGFGDIQPFDGAAAVLSFPVEENDLVDIGDEAGGDDDDQGGVDQGGFVVGRLVGKGLPQAEQEDGDGPGIDDIDQKQGYDDLMVLLEGPNVFFPDEVHEPDIALPDEEGKEGEIGVIGQQFGIGIKVIGDQPGDIGNKKPQYRYADELDHPVVERIFIVHSSGLGPILCLTYNEKWLNSLVYWEAGTALARGHKVRSCSSRIKYDNGRFSFTL